GGGPGRAEDADTWSVLLPRGGRGDGLGLRPPGAAVGDGVPGADARARPGDPVGAIDGPDRGRGAPLDRTAAAVGLHHRWRGPPGRLLPPGAAADERPPSSRPTPEVALGDRLLSRLRVHHEAIRGAILRCAGGAGWARKMRRWLREKPRGIYRVLHSAAAIRRR